jgi:cytoskeletal protein RodZ
MPTVAETLRQAREAQKKTVQQIADVTKIRTDHIRALEEGNFNVFSATVYIRGFVRTYATLLKLDVPQTMSMLDGELGQTEKFSEPPPLTDQPRTLVDWLMLQLSKVDWRKGLLALGAVLGIVIIFWLIMVMRSSRSSKPLQNLKPGVYHPTNRSGDTLPVPPPRR